MKYNLSRVPHPKGRYTLGLKHQTRRKKSERHSA